MRDLSRGLSSTRGRAVNADNMARLGGEPVARFFSVVVLHRFRSGSGDRHVQLQRAGETWDDGLEYVWVERET